MRIRTKINAFFGVSFILIIATVLTLTSLSARAYFRENLYNAMPYIAGASCSSLQNKLNLGLELSSEFVFQDYLINLIVLYIFRLPQITDYQYFIMSKNDFL